MSPSDIQAEINELATLLNKQQITMEEYNTRLEEIRQRQAQVAAEQQVPASSTSDPDTGLPVLPPDSIKQQEMMAAAEAEPPAEPETPPEEPPPEETVSGA